MESLQIAINIGISISDYNEMTPYELSLHIDRYKKRETYMQRERVTAAYMGAYFERVKTMPKLEDVLKEKPKEKKRQTAADMLAEVKKIHAALGGTVF